VTSRLHQTLLVIPAALALLTAGCGKDKEGRPIPASQAAELQRQLDSIESRFRFGDGACNDIQRDNVPTVERMLNQIPPSVDRDVKNAARDSFDRLFQLTAAQCDEQKGQETTPTQTETTPTQTETTPPTETETTPTETETQTQPQPGKKPKKKEGSTQGGGGAGLPQGDGGVGAAPGGGD
jgi:hypothetical protein